MWVCVPLSSLKRIVCSSPRLSVIVEVLCFTVSLTFLFFLILKLFVPLEPSTFCEAVDSLHCTRPPRFKSRQTQITVRRLHERAEQHKRAPSSQIPPQHMVLAPLSNKHSIGLRARVQAGGWWSGVCMRLGPGFFLPAFHPVPAQAGREPPGGRTSGFIGSSYF